MRGFFLVIAALALPASAFAQGFSYNITTPSGLECSAFDFSGGVMVTSGHCLDGRTAQVSDGRSTTVLYTPNLSPELNDIDYTDRDVGILMPSSPRKGLKPDNKWPSPGTTYYIAIPDGFMVPCDLLEVVGRGLKLGCSVQLGWSGSPVVRRTFIGRPRVVGVLSGREPDRDMSWATHVSVVQDALSN